MLHRLDSFHLSYPTAPSPACKPSPSSNEALRLAGLNVLRSGGKVVNPVRRKRVLGIPTDATLLIKVSAI